ncbi:PAS domain S-box protein [Haloparvum sedimenti]|uniref:PAS domain S-box protein n=1 Tax=Haloparvum sedimenti TaxID=1678448 RepID=UPI00071E7400|nr:PAS domain S-box protein [Haloparvum sedimenti]
MSIDPERDEALESGLDALPAGEFLRASPDPAVTVGLDGTVHAANPALERILGYAPAAVVGEPAEVLIPDRFSAIARELAAEYVETGESPVGTANLELLARHAEGHEVPVSVTLVEHGHAGEPVVTAVAREITGAIETREELIRERDRLSAALEALASDHDVHEVSVPDVAASAWATVETGSESLDIDVGAVVETDADRLKALLTALFAATAPEEGAVRVVGDADAVRVEGAAVATDLGAAPALAVDLGVALDVEPTAVTVSF